MKQNDACLPVRIAGLEFKNPFYVASGPTTRTLDQLLRIERAGWAAASVKLSMDPPPYINRVPRYGVFPQYNALAFTAEKRLTMQQSIDLIRSARRRLTDLLIMANITYAGEDGPDGWVRMAQAFEEAGADIIEFNMCCPNMSFNAEVTSGTTSQAQRTGASMGQNSEIVSEITRAVKKAISIPLFVKLTPEGGRIAEVAKALYAAGADVVGGTGNRLGIPPINLEDPGSSCYHLQDEISMSCYCGSWLKPLAQRDTYEIRKACGPDVRISATGGIRDRATALEMTMCGADLLGICTETLMRGYDFIGGVIAETRAWLDEHGYADLAAIRDRIVPEVRSAPELTLYKGFAKVDRPDLQAPCQAACPAGVPIQTLMKMMAEGRQEDAVARLAAVGPLQELCGYLCDAPCERACVKGRQTRHLAIREMERYLGAKAAARPWVRAPVTAEASARPVLVAGDNIAGLACAADLLRAGTAVTLTADSSNPIHDLPESVLPKTVLAGIRTAIESLGGVWADEADPADFAAVYQPASAGATTAVPGAIPALDFLRQKPDVNGKTVAVLGDGVLTGWIARAVQNGGGKPLILSGSAALTATLSRLSGERLPVVTDSIEVAFADGIVSFSGRQTGIRSQAAAMALVDATAAPAKTNDSSSPDDSHIAYDEGIGDGSPVQQIAAGQRAARRILSFLRDRQPLSAAPARAKSRPVVQAAEVLRRSAYPAAETPLRIMPGQTADRAALEQEAARCLRCGCGEGCDVCRQLCCEFAIKLDEQGRQVIDPERCVACGMCFNRCPNHNISMVSSGIKA